LAFTQIHKSSLHVTAFGENCLRFTYRTTHFKASSADYVVFWWNREL